MGPHIGRAVSGQKTSLFLASLLLRGPRSPVSKEPGKDRSQLKSNTSESKLSISSPTCSSLCLPRLGKWHHRPPRCWGQKTGRHPCIFWLLTTHMAPLPRPVHSTSKINPKSTSLWSHHHQCGQGTARSPRTTLPASCLSPPAHRPLGTRGRVPSYCVWIQTDPS